MSWSEINDTPFARTLYDRRLGWHLPQPLTLALCSLVEPEDVLHGVCAAEEVGDKPETTWEGLWLTGSGGLVHVTGRKAVGGWRQDRAVPQTADSVRAVLRRPSSIRRMVVVDVAEQDARREESWAWEPTVTVIFDDDERVQFPAGGKPGVWEQAPSATDALVIALRQAWLAAA